MSTATIAESSSQVGGTATEPKQTIIALIAFDRSHFHFMHHKHEGQKELTLVQKNLGDAPKSLHLSDVVSLFKEKIGMPKGSMLLPIIELGNFEYRDERSNLLVQIWVCQNYFKFEPVDGIMIPYKPLMAKINSGEDYISMSNEKLTPLTKAIFRKYKTEIQKIYEKAKFK